MEPDGETEAETDAGSDCVAAPLVDGVKVAEFDGDCEAALVTEPESVAVGEADVDGDTVDVPLVDRDEEIEFDTDSEAVGVNDGDTDDDNVGVGHTLAEPVALQLPDTDAVADSEGVMDGVGGGEPDHDVDGDIDGDAVVDDVAETVAATLALPVLEAETEIDGLTLADAVAEFDSVCVGLGDSDGEKLVEVVAAELGVKDALIEDEIVGVA